MQTKRLFENRRLNISLLDNQSRYISSNKLELERLLAHICDVKFEDITATTEIGSHSSDLVLIAAPDIQDAQFEQWLDKLVSRMHHPDLIWIPALIVAPIKFDTSLNAMRRYLGKNWYFDVVNPSDFSSLPVRIANLVRIHDHLRELQRYDVEIKSLGERVEQLELQVKSRG